ncbi:unnamed protein product, partial [Dicrocoelium dendriticum]
MNGRIILHDHLVKPIFVIVRGFLISLIIFDCYSLQKRPWELCTKHVKLTILCHQVVQVDQTTQL